MAQIYSVEQFEHNSELTAEFLSFVQGLIVPDASQRLASKESILAHPFIAQSAEAVALWEQVA